jgi:lipid A ethanolaminephosphotransferase
MAGKAAPDGGKTAPARTAGRQPEPPPNMQTPDMITRILQRLKNGYDCHIAVFALAYSVFTLAAYHKPLFAYAVNNVDLHSFGGFAVLAGLVIMQMAAIFLLIMLLSFLPFLVKPASALLLVTNSIAYYFVAEYNVMLDMTMMSNVFNTNYGEAAELISYRIILYILFLGVLPAAVVMRIKIRGTAALKRAGMIFGTLAFVVLFGYLNSKTWLWFDKNSKRVGGLTMPLSYIVNSIRHFREQAFLNTVDVPIPDSHFLSEDKTTVILVIGESARSANFSLYGYGRDTNPYLKKDGVAVIPGTKAFTTYTTESIRCMLAHLGEKTPSGTVFEALPSYLQRHKVNVLWRSNNWGEPKMKIARYEKADKLREACGAACGDLTYDEAMLYKLKEELDGRTGENNFIVLHQTGSHGPQYYTKYPPQFEKFTPVCRSVDLQKCTQDELVNAYDNTVLSTDYFLHQVISLLRALKNTSSVMIYISDHGESLGERGIYLHGTPYALAPDVQKDIPFIVWMSDKFEARRKLAAKDLVRNIPHSQGEIFNSVMGAFGMRSDFYNGDLDIFGEHANR